MRAESTISSKLKNLPAVDELLRSEVGRWFVEASGPTAATTAARSVIERLRAELLAGLGETAPEPLLARAEEMLQLEGDADRLSGIRRVINATGVIVHTNLGRAPLSDDAVSAVSAAAGYCTIEYDLGKGERGRRGARAERLIAEITGAEDAVIVNNCAAAAFFVLTVFAAGGEVVISRGELVEIGGDFRVPDVLAASGAELREVGTTNRTKLADYQIAIGERTRIVLRVHPSNYRVVGFTATPAREELVRLAHDAGVVYFEDIGSGALVDLSAYGLRDEPVVSSVIGDGADIVSFSGDKLLGGPQCGIIAGRKVLIDNLRRHPLQRALRADKKTYAALEATLISYRRGTHFSDVPVLRQLVLSADDLRNRAAAVIADVNGHIGCEIVSGESVVGGGAAPDTHPRSTLIALTHPSLNAGQIETKLRSSQPPLIARIEAERVLLDLRTVDPSDDGKVADILNSFD